jgi:AraC family transcriptional regulator of adaptative response / DNA-3-methyladenine glycosylase II
MPGVERVEGDRYLRSVRVGGARGLVEVRPDAASHQLLARLRLDAPAPLAAAAERLRRTFDLGADPHAIAEHLARDRRLAGRLRRHPGVRVPGAWDGFELAVRAILGQQVSVAAARVLAGRIAQVYGEPLRLEGDACAPTHLFPQPQALADVDPARVRLPRARAAAISALARAVVAGELALDGSRPLESVVPALQRLPGVGPWTAQVIAMRALREPDAFPAGDLGVRRALGSAQRPATAAEAEARSRAWRPWRAYAAVLLWQAAR